jgi:hypothetical protein
VSAFDAVGCPSNSDRVVARNRSHIPSSQYIPFAPHARDDHANAFATRSTADDVRRTAPPTREANARQGASSTVIAPFGALASPYAAAHAAKATDAATKRRARDVGDASRGDARARAMGVGVWCDMRIAF